MGNQEDRATRGRADCDIEVRTPLFERLGLGRVMTQSVIVLLLASGLGCNGVVSSDVDDSRRPDDDGPTKTPIDPGANPSSDDPACQEAAPGDFPLQRLTRTRFDNTVEYLFGMPGKIDTVFPETALSEGYRTWAESNTVTADGAGSIHDAAKAIAKSATADLDELLGCMPGQDKDDDCAFEYIGELARKAYRRPPTSGEVDVLEGLYSTLRDNGESPALSVAGVIEVVLQSPQFLYLNDFGSDPDAKPGDVVALTDHEIAAKVSYFLWDAPPDDRLAALADEGDFHRAKDVEEQVRLMLEDPRAQDMMARFSDDWMHMWRMDTQDKDADAFPLWNDNLKAAMRAEAGHFVNHVVFEEDGSLETLLSAPFTMANKDLAKVYGASASGNGFERVELDKDERAGLLTSAGFMAAHAGALEPFPVVRGAFVRHNILCQDLTPPPGLMIEVPAADPTKTARERFTEHSTNPACSGCHRLLDPIGFGLENYDALGAFRTTEGRGLDIDASGELVDAGEVSGPFEGGVELAKKLSVSEDVQECVAKQVFSHATGRPYTRADGCTVAHIKDRFSGSDADMRELLVAIATSDAFLYRRIPEAAE